MKTIHFESIDSTNTYLKQNYQSLDNMTFVSADYQTQGRGRLNRNWKSENGSNLLFSLLIKENELIEKFKSISVISAFSLIQVLEKYNINNLSIKWPNDVYINDSKVCGILLEAVTVEKIECLVIGIGLNVNQRTFEGEYVHSPTSIALELNKEIDIVKLKNEIFTQLEQNINSLKLKDVFYDSIVNYDYLKNKEVYAIIQNEKKLIKVIGINDDYSLKIKYDNKIEDIESGEISFHL